MREMLLFHLTFAAEAAVGQDLYFNPVEISPNGQLPSDSNSAVPKRGYLTARKCALVQEQRASKTLDSRPSALQLNRP